MKKFAWIWGVVLGTVVLTPPTFAGSLKSGLRSNLFGAKEGIGLTVPDQRTGRETILLSADPTSRGFGLPLQTGGVGGISDIFTQALGREILTESAVIPLPSGSAGFEYSYNPTLNVFERTSIGLGAIFNERVNTLGKGGLAFGVSYVRQEFDTYNGQDLSNLSIGKSLFRPQQSLGPFISTGIVKASVDLAVTTNTTALWGTYGLTDWLDVSVLIPITVISLRAKSTIEQGSPTLLEDLPVFLGDSQCSIQNRKCNIADFTVLRRGTRFNFPVGGVPGARDGRVTNRFKKTKTGFGDMILRSKARFFDSKWGNFGGLAELTLPTGRESNFLGDDAVKGRFLLLYSHSFMDNRLNFHLNGGGKVTTQTSNKNTLEYGSAVDFMITPQLSLIGELIGSWRVDPEGLPRNFIDGAFGFKANPYKGLILSASFRIPATNDGLRSDLVYLGGLEYDF
jgi:hypothetical protein